MKPPVVTRISQRAAAWQAKQGRGNRSTPLPFTVREQPPSEISDRIPDLTVGKQATSHGALHEQMCGSKWIRRL